MSTLTRLISQHLDTPLSHSKAYSGKEILDNLVLVADQADKKISPQLFEQIWHPFDGQYNQYIQEIVFALRLNERSLYHPHQPIGQYNKQHHDVVKENMLPHLSTLSHFDSNAFHHLSQNDPLILVSYHIWYNLNDSSNYFDDYPIPSIIADHKGIPETLKQKVSKLYEHYLKSKGLRKISEVEQEILTLLTPNRRTTSPVSILNSSHLSDIFQYNDRLFSLNQKYFIQKNSSISNNFSQNHSPNITLTHNGKWIDLLWALGIYTNNLDLIGYIQFNKKQNKTPSFLLS